MSTESKKPWKPPTLNLNGEPYPAVLILVKGKDEFGRPREGRFIYDEETVNLEGGEEFLVVFAHGKSIAKRS